MPDEVDAKIAKLVRRATVSAAQQAANDSAAETLARAAAREREELDDKWHADQPVLAGLALQATRSAAEPFAAFAYRSEPPVEAGSLGTGRFVVDFTDGAQAALHLDARATGRVALDYGDVDAEALAREMPLLTAGEEAYAGAIVAFLAVLQKAKREG